MSRGTAWGNPYRVESNGGGKAGPADWYVTLGEGNSFSAGPFDTRAEAHAEAARLYKAHITARAPTLDWSRLRGRNLACWCPLDMPCHADVLLEIANGGTSL